MTTHHRSYVSRDMVAVLSFLFLSASLPAFSNDKPMKIAIIKADDVRGAADNWKRFFALSSEKGVKVSAGIICNSLEGDKKDYHSWLKQLNASGAVEFWNHGWDHKQWATNGNNKITEFGGSGYTHQKKHFEDAQKLMKDVLGFAPIAFGTPYNKQDSDTMKVLNENADMRLLFCYKAQGLEGQVLAPMSLRGEHDGTGKPNFEKFKAEYEAKKDLSFAALQVHPNGWGDAQFAEYGKIIDFMLAEGWTFMLPAEYVKSVEQAKQK